MNTEAREILKRELARRCSANPQYSLRAFAKTLGLSPASLSLMLSGKRIPSRRSIARMVERIELSARERSALTGISEPVADNLSLENAERICSWISYAVLSLSVTKGFQSNPDWIAKRLGISIHEVRLHLEALVEAKLLDCRRKPWRPIHAGLRIKNRVSTAKTREFQRQLIARALHSMEFDPMEERDLTSITFAMSPKQMAAAKEEIRKFRLKMAELFEESGRSEEVYNLTVQLIPVTRGSK